MVDLASMQSLSVATGGTRGEFIHIGPDGRLFVTQANQVDVFSPLTPPRIIASLPVSGSAAVIPFTEVTLTFNQRMFASRADSATASVFNVDLFNLKDVGSEVVVPIGAISYDEGTATAKLQFESLLPDAYTLTISGDLESAAGVAMGDDVSIEFVVVEQLFELDPQFSNTRLDREAGTVSFDVTVTNDLDIGLDAPVRMILRGLAGTGISLLNADGFTGNGDPFVDLAAPGIELFSPGDTTVARTLTFSDPSMAPLHLDPFVITAAPENDRPVFTTEPVLTAAVSQPYQYDADASDPDGVNVSFALLLAPRGAVVDATTGVVTWTPDASAEVLESFELRAYDARGGYTRQLWQVQVEGGNVPPQLLAIADQRIEEGQTLTVPVGAFDTDGGSNHY